jgi:hypothetical protein
MLRTMMVIVSPATTACPSPRLHQRSICAWPLAATERIGTRFPPRIGRASSTRSRS